MAEMSVYIKLTFLASVQQMIDYKTSPANDQQLTSTILDPFILRYA